MLSTTRRHVLRRGHQEHLATRLAPRRGAPRRAPPHGPRHRPVHRLRSLRGAAHPRQAPTRRRPTASAMARGHRCAREPSARDSHCEGSGHPQLLAARALKGADGPALHTGRYAPWLMRAMHHANHADERLLAKLDAAWHTREPPPLSPSGHPQGDYMTPGASRPSDGSHPRVFPPTLARRMCCWSGALRRSRRSSSSRPRHGGNRRERHHHPRGRHATRAAPRTSMHGGGWPLRARGGRHRRPRRVCART